MWILLVVGVTRWKDVMSLCGAQTILPEGNYTYPKGV
jgi:hypothetical protein